MVNFGKQVKWRVTGKGYCGDILEWQEKLGTVVDRVGFPQWKFSLEGGKGRARYSSLYPLTVSFIAVGYVVI